MRILAPPADSNSMTQAGIRRASGASFGSAGRLTGAASGHSPRRAASTCRGRRGEVGIRRGFLSQAVKLLELQGRAEGVLLGGTESKTVTHQHSHVHQVVILPAMPVTQPAALEEAEVIDAEPLK